MTHSVLADRKAKGINVIDLVKTVKIYRRTHSNVRFSPKTEAILKEHVLPSRWYPHKVFLELLDFTYKNMLASREDNAVKMGITGGLVVLKEYHSVYIIKGDPAATLLSMRHCWRGYFNFGEHTAELLDSHTVYFTVQDYPDMPMTHGYSIVGWDIAAAQLAGAKNVTYKLRDLPWKGASKLSYNIRF